jgi:hypothetical protein
MGQEVNALAVMADTFVRLVMVETVKVMVWLPAYVGLVWFHVWLTNRRG